MQITDCAALLIADLASGEPCAADPSAGSSSVCGNASASAPSASTAGRLKLRLDPYRLQLADPHCTVPRSAANRTVTAGDDRPRPAAQGAVPAARRTAGSSGRTGDLRRPENRRRNGSCAGPLRSLAAPIDCALRLPQQRLPTVARFAIAAGQRTQARRTRASAARTATTAPSVTSWRYRLLLRAARMGNEALAQTGPASSSSCACKTVTPQRPTPRKIAQSSADGPRSPGGPGCTMRQRCRCQIDGGIARFRNGASIKSGRNSSTASPVTRSWISSSTDSS